MSFRFAPALEYVVPARANLQTKSNLSSGNLSLSENEVLSLSTVGHYRKRYEAGGISGLLKDAYLGS